MKRKGFCEHKFSSMFISGTFTKAVMYIIEALYATGKDIKQFVKQYYIWSANEN